MDKHNSIQSVTGFFTQGDQVAFAKLRQAFSTTPILSFFDLECHIRMAIYVSGHVMGGIFDQMTS